MSDIPRIQVQLTAVRDASWQEYAIRFLFGGVVTASVGIVGKAFGPVVAGLFLAFPCVLPASLTLIAEQFGEKQSGEDALGAVWGSLGLAVFAAVVWFGAPRLPAWVVLTTASATWMVTASALWAFFESRTRGSRGQNY